MTRNSMTHAELVEAGKLVATSEMFGKINPASGYMIAAICDQKGISYLEFNETYNWMHNAPTMKADAMLAKFVELGGRYKMIERTADRACIEVEFEGNKHTFSITWEEVKDEPFTMKQDGKTTKSNYATPRKRMQSLASRAVSDAVHTVCPQACKGIYTTEEQETFENDDRPVRRDAPVVLGSVEAERRAKQAAIESADAEKIDYTVAPIGPDGIVGVPWADLDDNILEFALKSDNPAMTHTHKAAVRLVVEQRKEGGAE